MIVSVPVSALGVEPLTGASRKPIPRCLRRSASSRLDAGAIVVESITSEPSAIAPAAPSSPSSTAST